MPINNLIFCRNFEVVPDEFISCRCRANNASAKIEGVMDDNYQQNALIILLASASQARRSFGNRTRENNEEFVREGIFSTATANILLNF